MLLLSACPSPEPYRPPPIVDTPIELQGPPAWGENAVELEIREGTEYQPLPASTALHAGSQGGFHLPINVKVTNHSGPQVDLNFRATRSSDGLLVSRTRTNQTIDAADGGTWRSAAQTMFLCPTPTGINIAGEEIIFEVTASIGSQLLTSTRAKTVLLCETSDCNSLCKG